MGGYNHDTIICHNPGDVLWWASGSPMGQKLIYYRSRPNAHIIIITLNVYCNTVLLLLITVNLVHSFITNMSVLKKDIYFLKEFSSSLQWVVTKLRKIKRRRQGIWQSALLDLLLTASDKGSKDLPDFSYLSFFYDNNICAHVHPSFSNTSLMHAYHKAFWFGEC